MNENEQIDSEYNYSGMGKSGLSGCSGKVPKLTFRTPKGLTRSNRTKKKSKTKYK